MTVDHPQDNPYVEFVDLYIAAIARGQALPTPEPVPNRTVCKRDARVLVMFSPHPDDESLVGALPLRLKRDAGMRVVNVPVTFGGDRERRAERQRELVAACAFVGFEIEDMRPGGFANISPSGRESDPNNWDAAVRAAARVINHHRPAVILVPHDHELHPTHIGTHQLVMEALASQQEEYRPCVIEWEYWTPMRSPNLLLQVPRGDVATLVAAVSLHVGEAARYALHVGLPAWMQDNVRRGASILGGMGATPPRFEFGTLYRVRRWSRRELRDVPPPRVFLAHGDPVSWLLPGVNG